MELHLNTAAVFPVDVPNLPTEGAMAFPTNSTFLSSPEALYTYPELLFCAVGLSVLTAVSLAGNSLVLVAVARTKKLQNVTNVFVVSLSVSDCLSGLAFLWSVPGMVSKTPGYPLATDVPCVIAAAVIHMTVSSSLNSLANIALNRCILITRPKETYQWLYTPKKIALMVFSSWFVPLCATIIPPLSGIGDLGFDTESRTCSDIDTHPRAATYDKIQFAVFYPIPFVTIIVSYIVIWRYLKKHFRKRREHVSGRLQSSTVTPSAMSSTSVPDADDGAPRSRRVPRNAVSCRQLSRMRNDQVAITKNLFMVVLAFMVCFTPLAIMVVAKSNRYQLYSALMLFLSGCVNPLIYAAKHPHFGPVLRALVRCRCSSY